MPDKIERARLLLSSAYTSRNQHMMAAMVIAGRFDGSAEMDAVVAAMTLPVGWVAVPEAITQQMEDAYDEVCINSNYFDGGLYLPAYDAMIAARSEVE